MKHVQQHQRFLDEEVLQGRGTLRQLLIDKPEGAMRLLQASPAAVRAAAAYLQDKLGWSEEVLASRVVFEPSLFKLRIKKWKPACSPSATPLVCL